MDAGLVGGLPVCAALCVGRWGGGWGLVWKHAHELHERGNFEATPASLPVDRNSDVMLPAGLCAIHVQHSDEGVAQQL